MKCARQAASHVVLLAFLVVLIVNVAFAGSAQVSQIDNLQKTRMQGGDADVTRNENLQARKLNASNADVTRNNNLMGFRLVSHDADISQGYNLIGLRLASQDADIVQTHNSLGSRLGPSDADVSKSNNLLALLLEQPLLPQIDITTLSTTDSSGNAKTSFHVGDVVQVRFTVANIGAFNLPRGLISVMIQDPSATPIFLAYTFDDISIGSSKEFVFGLTMPYSSISGQYTAKAMVYTKWPYEGGVGLAIRTVNFNVSI